MREKDKILHSEKDTFKENLLVVYRCHGTFGFNNTKNALSFSEAESLLHTENAEKLQGVNSWKQTSDFSLFLTKNVFCVGKTNLDEIKFCTLKRIPLKKSY